MSGRRSALRRRLESIPCRECGAAAGYTCHTRHGHPCPPHVARNDAAVRASEAAAASKVEVS